MELLDQPTPGKHLQLKKQHHTLQRSRSKHTKVKVMLWWKGQRWVDVSNSAKINKISKYYTCIAQGYDLTPTNTLQGHMHSILGDTQWLRLIIKYIIRWKQKCSKCYQIKKHLEPFHILISICYLLITVIIRKTFISAIQQIL